MGDHVDLAYAWGTMWVIMLTWHIPGELRWSNVAYNIDRAVVTESQEHCDAWSEEFVQTCKDELCSANFKLCMQVAV